MIRIAIAGKPMRQDRAIPFISTNQPTKLQRAGTAYLPHKVADQHSKTDNDNQQVKKNDELKQHWHAGDKYLRTKEDAVLKHKKSEYVADRFVSDSQHQIADQLHRQHYSQREYDNLCCGRQRVSHPGSDHERKHHAGRPKY